MEQKQIKLDNFNGSSPSSNRTNSSINQQERRDLVGLTLDVNILECACISTRYAIPTCAPEAVWEQLYCVLTWGIIIYTWIILLLWSWFDRNWHWKPMNCPADILKYVQKQPWFRFRSAMRRWNSPPLCFLGKHCEDKTFIAGGWVQFFSSLSSVSCQNVSKICGACKFAAGMKRFDLRIWNYCVVHSYTSDV